MTKQRPKHLDLHLIRLPFPGLVSILHRVSGLLLFLALPVLLLMLQYSLLSIETHTRLMAALAHPLAKLALLGLTWAFLHHFCAGLRFLAIDLHLVRGLAPARGTGAVVLAAGVLLTLLFGAKLW